MNRFDPIITLDGSLTLFDHSAGESFKSRHAAHLEAATVFVNPGLEENPWREVARPFRVLEFGFGIATNCRALVEIAAEKYPLLSLDYLGIDRDLAGVQFLLEQNGTNLPTWLPELVAAGEVTLSPQAYLQLRTQPFLEALDKIAMEPKFHAIFFDPFSPKSNPEAWVDQLFQACFAMLEPGGRLVTYSVSRITKNGLAMAGFRLEKRRLPEQLNKREALLAIKP